jgi:hypothetical protein
MRKTSPGKSRLSLPSTTFCALLGLVLTCSSSLALVSLERNAGTPKSYNWDAAKASAKDPLLNPVFSVLKKYKVPSATMGYQLNPDPKIIPYTRPKKWRNPQAWWMAGFGINYRAPMRVASVSKPILAIAYQNHPILRSNLDMRFYQLWRGYINSNLPEPKDPRVKDITLRHLLNHVGGFDKDNIGFDPAYTGKTVEAQLPGILKDKMLASAPGTKYSYSNFSYMILARLAQALTAKPWMSVVRSRFPAGTPIHAGRDKIPVGANTAPAAGASEPSIYWLQGKDGEFVMEPKIGEGNLLSNVATLTWIATQYWINGDTDFNFKRENTIGMPFSSKPPVPGELRGFNGSMPGTQAALIQYTTPKGRVASMCVIVNTRVTGKDFLSDLNKAMVRILQDKFGKF